MMMMAITITCINSALNDLVLLNNIAPHWGYKNRLKRLMHSLRNLRTFLICARNVLLKSDDNNTNNKDVSLASLLERIEDEVSKIADEIHSHSLRLEDGFPIASEYVIIHFQDIIQSFKEEIDEWWHITLSDYLQQSSSPTTDEVMEILDSILENLLDYFIDDDLVVLIQALGEKLSFLKIFIRFSTMRGIGQPQLDELLTHIQAVAVHAAHLSYMWQFIRRPEDHNEMKFKIPELLQKIKPVDPQAYQAYTEALTSSKLSRQLHAATDQDTGDDPIIILKDFIDSLACNLWEMLQMDSCLVVSMKDQKAVLYEKLGILRTILNKHPKKYDEEMRDLAGVVAYDAAIIICLLSQKDVEKDIGLTDFLERIKLIRTEVERQVPETSKFNFPRTNELGFIDFLLENLMELTSSKGDSNALSRVQKIQEELIVLRSFLGKIVELRNEQEELQALWSRIVEVAYRIEFLIDPLMGGDIPDSFLTSFDSITQDIMNIKNDTLKINKREEIKVKKVTRTSSHVLPQSCAPITNEVVGLDVEAISIIDRLKRGSKQLRMVAIVGMPGLGKTTLATKVYNDPSVMYYFHIRAWCSVSQVFDKKKVLLDLLNHIVIKLPDRYLEMTEQDLAEELQRCLKGRRYLIVLDDVWDIEAWKNLEGSLPNDSNGSRIVLTSRLCDVALLDEEPHFLRQLTNEESLELLQRKLFAGKGWPSALYKLGMQIVENCRGLPLTIITVAGILANMEQESWKEILESFYSGIISSTEQCMNTLELSYKHLPDYLKSCLLYFGAFPEDKEVSVKGLIWLWIAEGFIQKTGLKSLEDVAFDYIMDLVGRSLVMVANKTSMGSVKTCRMHDLVHDFCVTKAKEENFFRLLKGYDELLAFNEPYYLRRLCVHSSPDHFKKSKIFCPHVRYLLFFTQTEWYQYNGSHMSFVIHSFRLLRVLDLQQIDLGFHFPSEIVLLVHLRYLAVQGMMNDIPLSIGKLSNLQTFIVISLGNEIKLPYTIWNLQKLRHLYMRKSEHSTFSLYIEKQDNSSDLYELDSLSGALFYWDSMEKQMRKFPNIRKLRCKIFPHIAENCNKILVLDFLSQLESLNVSSLADAMYHKELDFEFKFGFLTNLKKLTLSSLWWPWSKISTIGKLPNLEVLKLLDGSFSGYSWNMEEGEFLKLRFLKLASLNLFTWTASDDQFLYLQKIVLVYCHNLEEIPSCLENISTLEMIEVSYCSDSTARLVKQIQEEQTNMGNSVLLRFSG